MDKNTKKEWIFRDSIEIDADKLFLKHLAMQDNKHIFCIDDLIKLKLTDKVMDSIPKLPFNLFRMIIDLKAMIDELVIKGDDYNDLLEFFYKLKCVSSFSIPYCEKARIPGNNITSIIPGALLMSLDIKYKEIGYEKLNFRKKEVKLLTSSWGEPDNHTTMNDLYNDIWCAYDDYFAEKKLERENNLVNEIRSEILKMRNAGATEEEIQQFVNYLRSIGGGRQDLNKQ